MDMFELHLFDSRYHRQTGDDITVLEDTPSLNHNVLIDLDKNENHLASIILTERENSRGSCLY